MAVIGWEVWWDLLQHNDLKADAGVYKAKDGINSNLRWGVPGPNLQVPLTRLSPQVLVMSTSCDHTAQLPELL